MHGPTDFSSSPTKENDSPFDSDSKRTSVGQASPSIGMPSSRAALSWQRRPPSQASDRQKTRPLSVVAAENAARNAPSAAEQAPETERALSRDQIAQSLAGKDPSWFRQTADPGRGSGAFRKTQVEDQDTVDLPTARTQLHGLSGQAATESSKEIPAARPVTPTALPSKLGSPLPLTGAQRLEPPVDDGAEDTDTTSANRQSLTSPLGRTSPTRPVSPTKGMGGFVQSAMMKRSDSVKRWSVNSPAGLQRVDSVRSSVGGADTTQRPTTPKSGVRPKSMLREASEPPAPAPAEPEPDKETGAEDPAATAQLVTPTETKTKDDEEKMTPPSSPSKTMDPRRWSPTKNSSWLEAALNKPESPKAKPIQPPPTQPAWMLELNKAKTQKSSVDLARSATLPPKKPEVKTGGLMRSTPMGASLKPSALGGFPAGPPVTATDKPADVSGFRGGLRRASAAADDRRGSQGELAADAKVKPEAPAKKDFRANLKPRAPPPGSTATGATAELATVFGTLRRVKTQNFVPPDELKDNILRGKSSLSVTGGPKKAERVDEFKDAILKKKDDFKKAQQDGRGITREPSSATDKSLPEGIAKKLEFQRTGTFSKQTPTTPSFPLQSPALTGSTRASHVSIRSRHDVPVLGSETVSKATPETTKAATPISAAPVAFQKLADTPTRVGKAGGLADRFNPALAGLLARGPPPSSGPSRSSGASSASGTPPAETEPAVPGPQLTHMTKNRARGPRRKAPTSAATSAEEPKAKAVNAFVEQENRPIIPPPEPKKTSFPSPTLDVFIPSHKLDQTATPSKPGKPVISPKPEKFAAPTPEIISLVDSRKSLIHDKPKPVGEVISLVDSARNTTKEEPKSVGQPITLVGSTPIKTRPRSPTKVHEQVAALAALGQQSPKPAEMGGETAVQPPSPRKLDMKRMSRFFDEQGQSIPKPEDGKSRPSSPTRERSWSVKSRPSSPVRDRSGSVLGPSSPTKDSEPVKPRPTSQGRERSWSVKSRQSSPVKDRFPGLDSPSIGQQPGTPTELKPALPIRDTAATFGGVGLGLTRQPAAAPQPPVEKPVEFERRPPVPAKTTRPLPMPPAVNSPPPLASPRIQSPTRSPGKQSDDVSALIGGFFGPERPRQRYTADAAEVLMRRPASTAKIQTQRAQLVQLTAEGKRIPVPSHNERVLFEREMYVCLHTYLDSARRKVNEVYFWAGDEVPESEAEDAQLFAAREARAFGGKLVKLTQGKETSQFIQALGGIVIIRRGSSNKYDSLAPNLLCGRRYLGQVAFDEVDFSPLSLCSGFPYLITQQGKCYLWKGKGSDVEELGCARLVGMDLALMGELVEVEEGREPESFWNIFGGNTRPTSADHWRLKPNYDKYSGRLFCANAGDQQQVCPLLPQEHHHPDPKMLTRHVQITELSPFSQTDLLPSSIYVLDAFFEMYIIVGARSQHQYAAFRNALDFAQEYAILAAGMEDRPFVPISTVVLEGIPRDLKSVFRKWRDGASPTVMHVSSPGVSGGSGSGSGGPVSGGRTGGLRRARSLRIVPLTQALQALAE